MQAVTARANAFSLVRSDNRTAGAMIIGVDPESEARVSTLETLVRRGEFFTEAEPAANPALIGRLMAQSHQVNIGDEIVVLGQGRDGSVAATALTVCGIYASGMDEFDRSTCTYRLIPSRRSTPCAGRFTKSWSTQVEAMMHV